MSKQKGSIGFTLIEIIVVFSVIAILSTAGIASFVTYSRSQTVEVAAQDIVAMLNTAKSRALSQVKPVASPCGEAGEGGVLQGYRVSISANNYRLSAVCGGNDYFIPNENKPIPTSISITAGTGTYTFRVLTGGVIEAGVSGTAVTLRGYQDSRYEKTITVYPDGRIKY